MPIRNITSVDLAAVSGGGEVGKLAYSALIAYPAGVLSWATGYGATLVVGNSLGLVKKHMNPRADAITTGLGVAAGLSGAFFAGKAVDRSGS